MCDECVARRGPLNLVIVRAFPEIPEIEENNEALILTPHSDALRISLVVNNRGGVAQVFDVTEDTIRFAQANPHKVILGIRVLNVILHPPASPTETKEDHRSRVRSQMISMAAFN